MKPTCRILGFIAALFTFIGFFVKWLKENKKNCYREAGIIDDDTEDDFPPINEK